MTFQAGFEDLSLGGQALRLEWREGSIAFQHHPHTDMLRGVLDTAVAYGTESFVQSLAHRCGQSFEGVVSYGFHRQDPDEIPPNYVELNSFEGTVSMPEPDFLLLCAVYLQVTSAKHGLELNDGILEQPLKPFRPSVSVEIRHHQPNSGTAGPLVGQMLWGSAHGRLGVHQPRWQELLETVFFQLAERQRPLAASLSAETIRDQLATTLAFQELRPVVSICPTSSSETTT